MGGILFGDIDYNRYKTDFGRRAADYAAHRQGFPPELFRRLAALGVGRPGQRAVDLGTGTGDLARGFAAEGCEVVGLDVSEDMLAAARSLSPELTFRAAPAERTDLEGGAWDVVSAGQCWHWFDRPAALAEAQRLLRPGGALVITFLDWMHGRPSALGPTVGLLRKHHPAIPEPIEFPSDAMYHRWIPDLEGAGFTALEVLAFDVDLLYTHEGWRGRLRASMLLGATLTSEEAAALDAALAELLAADFPEEPMIIPHRVFALAGFKDRAPIRADVREGREGVARVGAGAWSPTGRDGTARRRALAREAAGQQLGCSHYVLPPGGRAFPRHAHLVNEEAILVLAGAGALTVGESTLRLGAGDYAALPAGPGGAHQLVNTGDRPLEYLCLSTMVEAEVVLYPDSDKVGVLVGSAPGGDRSRRVLTEFWRRGDAVDYWAEEPSRG